MTVRSRCAMVRIVLFANSLLGVVNFSNRVSMLQNELSDSLSNELVSRVVDAKVMLHLKSRIASCGQHYLAVACDVSLRNEA